MKRYKLYPGHAPWNPGVLTEDANGEWVQWKDSKDELFRISEIYEKRIRELKVQVGQECNCEKMYNYDKRIDWFCPAHGYKKR